MQGLHRTQSALLPTEQKSADACQDFIINHQIDPITDGRYQIPRRPQNQFPMQQRPMRCHNRSRSKSRGRRFATQNFFNQTMTQIVQGKNREIQPLVDRRRLQPPSFGALYPAQQFAPQGYSQAPIEPFYETPKKEAQYAFGDQDLMNTQESTPYIKHPVDGAPAPFNAYEDVQMRFASPVRGASGLHPFAQMTSPVKVGVRMQQMEKNDFQPHTP
jgi:hypothetical protein